MKPSDELLREFAIERSRLETVERGVDSLLPIVRRVLIRIRDHVAAINDLDLAGDGFPTLDRLRDTELPTSDFQLNSEEWTAVLTAIAYTSMRKKLQETERLISLFNATSLT